MKYLKEKGFILISDVLVRELSAKFTGRFVHFRHEWVNLADTFIPTDFECIWIKCCVVKSFNRVVHYPYGAGGKFCLCKVMRIN